MSKIRYFTMQSPDGIRNDYAVPHESLYNEFQSVGSPLSTVKQLYAEGCEVVRIIDREKVNIKVHQTTCTSKEDPTKQIPTSFETCEWSEQEVPIIIPADWEFQRKISLRH